MRQACVCVYKLVSFEDQCPQEPQYWLGNDCNNAAILAISDTNSLLKPYTGTMWKFSMRVRGNAKRDWIRHRGPERISGACTR